jgi:hypothetical protein
VSYNARGGPAPELEGDDDGTSTDGDRRWPSRCCAAWPWSLARKAPGLCRGAGAPGVPPRAGRAVSPGSRPARGGGRVPVLHPAEKAAVEEFLRLHEDLRAGGRRRSPGFPREPRPPSLRRLSPYFVRGRSETTTDFRARFRGRVHPPGPVPRHTLVLRRGLFTGTTVRTGGVFRPAPSSRRTSTLARGDLSVDRDAVLNHAGPRGRSRPALPVGSLRRAYMFVRDDDEEEDTPIPSRT